jgi:hypothetical protein
MCYATVIEEGNIFAHLHARQRPPKQHHMPTLLNFLIQLTIATKSYHIKAFFKSLSKAFFILLDLKN